MKNFKLKRLLGLTLFTSLTVLSASNVYAAAGDTISNTATLNFNVGGAPTSVNSNTESFIEDNLVNFTVATIDPVAGVPVAPGSLGQVLNFTVTNNGNGAQDFALSALNLVGDQFDPAAFSIFVDDPAGASPGVYDAGDTATFIDELAGFGGSITVFIVSDIPAPLNDGDISQMTLVAEVRAGDPAGATGALGAALVDHSGVVDDKATEQNVFNDPSSAPDLISQGPDVADSAQNGFHSDTSQYIVAAAVLSVSKSSAVIWDPVNGAIANNPKAIPGAYVQYTLVVSNTGTGSGDLTTLTDTLVAALALDVDLLDGTGVPPVVGAATIAAGETFDVAHGGGSTRTDPVSCTSVADADGCDVAGQAITIDFAVLMAAEDIAPAGAGPEDYADGELKPGETVTIIFNAVVQ